MKHRVLIADSVAEEGVELLKKTASVTVKTGLTEKELCEIIPKFDAMIVRSATRVTKPIIKAAKNLKIIGRAGVGVDNIDVEAATQAGVVVVNSPQGNTLSAAELTVSMLLSMTRNIPQADRSMRDGQWDKKSFTGTEVYQKTLGVIGMGKIGSIVLQRAIAMGMKGLVYDPFTTEEQVRKLGAEPATLQKIFKTSDFITVHVPKTKQTYRLIGAEQFAMMKKGVRIVNCARGGIIDEEALVDAIRSKKVAGAALDVFETEPLPADSPLRKESRIILTPHLGASTEEAQLNVVIDVARQIQGFFEGVPPVGAVNMPSVKPEILSALQPYFTLAERMGVMQANLVSGPVKSITITYSGDITARETSLITRYVLVGFLSPILSEPVNFVNASIIARQRGIAITESTREELNGRYRDLITVEVVAGKSSREIAGTLYNHRDPHIVQIDGYDIDMVPQGTVLLVRHKDKPGMIGQVGTLLGSKDINIAGMQVGRIMARGDAVMALTIDDAISESALAALRKIKGLQNVTVLKFNGGA